MTTQTQTILELKVEPPSQTQPEPAPRTIMEFKVEPPSLTQPEPAPPTLPQPEPAGNPVDVMWHGREILPSCLSDVNLEDPATDNVLWCAKFRKWRAIKRVSAHAAVAALQWYLPDTTYWDMSGIDTEWRLSGRGEPQTEHDWEDYLAFSLELVSTKACWGLAPTKETLNRQWEGLVQGNQNAWHFATSILKLADQFKRLKTPIIKSVSDIQDKLMAGANPSLRLYLRTARLFADPAEEPSPEQAKLVLNKMIHNAKVYDAILAEEGIHLSRRSIHEGAHRQ